MIENYQFPRVAKFIRETIESAKIHGQVRTITGRIRELPDINSSDPTVSKRCERQAVNSVIQGSAADIVCGEINDLLSYWLSHSHSHSHSHSLLFFCGICSLFSNN
jgi:DNA polymerase-1